MASKLHCDLCDAVIPDKTECIVMMKRYNYTNVDWKYCNDAIMGCYDCMEALLPSFPDTLRDNG